MRRPKALTILPLALGAALLMATIAVAHTQFAGGGNDTVVGHDHADYLHGGAGCDDVLGHGSSDTVIGGDNGCDHVRGMGGFADDVYTWEDNYGNDVAYGGDGGGDDCFVGGADRVDLATCEFIQVG